MPEEKSMLDAWLTDEDNKRDFEKLKDKDFLHQMITEYYDYDIEEGKSITQQKLQNRAKVIHLRNWMRYAAAVIVLMIGSVTFYFLILKKHENRIVEQPTLAKANNDVAPGRYRAKLTLADGSFIVLDSVMIGKLAQQGGTQVMNKDGKLVYQAKDQANTLNKETLYNKLETAKGQTYSTVLSDGTRVWLNSNSSISYPVSFNGEERKVTITGEAYFEVATAYKPGTKEKQPFIVDVKGMKVEVLGTHFNINAYDDEPVIKTTLLEGKVKITSGKTTSLLTPGQQLQLQRGTDIAQKIDDADVQQAVAWKNGYFQFDNDDLKTVMRQLSRWYDVEVVYRGNVSGTDTYGGKIKRDTKASEVLALLAQNVHFEIQGKKIIITPDK
jgi:ferric-dicitrate binding protein FerR (iron transport regulator)